MHQCLWTFFWPYSLMILKLRHRKLRWHGNRRISSKSSWSPPEEKQLDILLDGQEITKMKLQQKKKKKKAHQSVCSPAWHHCTNTGSLAVWGEKVALVLQSLKENSGPATNLPCIFTHYPHTECSTLQSPGFGIWQQLKCHLNKPMGVEMSSATCSSLTSTFY